MLWVLSSVCARAQRVDENAVDQAEDAFGLTVGQETIGLYAADNARGFSPKDAGNVVIDGLYFDQQTPGITQRIAASTNLRVGLAAQSFPLAAPTGVVDYSLRRPGSERITSVSLGMGPYDSETVAVDAQLPLSPSVSIGFGGGLSLGASYQFARQSSSPSLGAILRWQPTARSEVIPFFGWSSPNEDGERPVVFLQSSALPPQFEQRKLPTQSWSHFGETSVDSGVLGNVDFENGWRVRSGVFISQMVKEVGYSEYLFDAEPTGLAQYHISAVPEQKLQSWSGELRLERVIVDDARVHTFRWIGRARDRERHYGGEDDHLITSTVIGQIPRITQLDFEFQPRDTTHTAQHNLGITYGLRWREVGEFGLGVQYAQVKQDTLDGETLTTTSSSEGKALYSASGAFSFGSPWTLFASYSRGLEEGGTAPDNAANAREAVPLVLSSQVDAGVRYAIGTGASAVLSAFEIQKPYYGLSPVNVYTEIATVTHRGIEFSLAGKFLNDLNVVAGYVYLRPRLQGSGVVAGTLGSVPVGSIPHVAKLDISYKLPALQGFALEGAARYDSSYVASQDNLLFVPEATEIDLGFRYRFSLRNNPTSVRFQAKNLNNDLTWVVKPSGEARMTEGRRYTLTLTTDL